MIKVLAIYSQFNEIGKNDYSLWRPIVHSNFEVTKLILGFVAQNFYRNAWLIGLKYGSKYWQIIAYLDERGENDYTLWRPIVLEILKLQS